MAEKTETVPLKERRILGRTIPQLVTQGAAVALLATFIFQNQERVAVRFLVWEIGGALVWALTASAGLGFLIGYLTRGQKG
ncbi:MAG: LapA family protein [Armatimonadota bacterium]